MIVLPTAKILLFIALNLGPHNSPMIYATSNSESYVWTPMETGWTVVAKGFPSADNTRNPDQCADIAGSPSQDSVPPYLRAVAQHNWSHDSAMVFDNGDRVEKRGDHAFYIINAGGANEKVFTILYPVDDND
jgi:hypothetical protein